METSQYSIAIASLDEIIGNGAAVAELRKFASDVERGIKRRPLLIYGPSGTGKTAAAHALASEFKWNMVELSASDYRDKETIEKVLISASNSRTLFGKRNVIILDEIDELAPKFDKGANTAIPRLIRESKSPIMLIANDKWDKSIAFLRGLTDDVRFTKVPEDTMASALTRLSDSRKLGLSRVMIAAIAKTAAGDVRSAFMDAFALSGAGDEATDIIGLRDRKAEIFTALDRIFSSYTIAASQSAQRSISGDIELDMVVNWMEENIPNRYSYPSDISAAYDSIARSTMFLSRAMRSQNYNYWKYSSLLVSSGVALAKRHSPTTFKRYAFPRVIKELSASKEGRGTDKQIAAKMQRTIHASLKVIASEYFPIFNSMIRLAHEHGMEEEAYSFFESRYGLSDKEIKWLGKGA